VKTPWEKEIKTKGGKKNKKVRERKMARFLTRRGINRVPIKGSPDYINTHATSAGECCAELHNNSDRAANSQVDAMFSDSIVNSLMRYTPNILVEGFPTVDTDLFPHIVCLFGSLIAIRISSERSLSEPSS
jgi:hypothetical protein